MLPGTDQENAALVSARIQETVNNTEIVIPGVCVLPPMKIVIGATMMSAFVSSRKLVDDAFAAFERSRALQLAVMAEPAIEATLDPESPVADDSAVPAVEAQQMDAADPEVLALLAAESAPAVPDNTTAGSAAETLSEGAFCALSTPESMPVVQAEDEAADRGAGTPEQRPDSSSNLAA
jgi:hypothetical protein